MLEDRSEDGSAKAWESVGTLYDENGDIESRETYYDDGTTKLEEFEGGTRTLTVQEDDSEDGSAKTWESIETRYDEDGVLERQETSYDDGTHKVASYENGSLVSVIITDNSEDGSAERWSTYVEGYDADGLLNLREVFYDDGTTQREYFGEGESYSIYQTDDSEDGSAQSWELSTQSYDENGDMTVNIVHDDDGTKLEEYFEDGKATSRLETDDSIDGTAEEWTELSTQYDENGNIELYEATYDDGRSLEERFEDGIRVATTEVLLVDDGSGDKYSIFTLFDENGDIETSTKSLEDGYTEFTSYADGERVGTFELDGSADGSAYEWSEITTEYYDSGEISSRVTTYDNGLEYNEFFYEDGGLSLEGWSDKSEDGSAAPWQATATFYDEDGDVLNEQVLDETGDLFVFEFSDDGTTRDIVFDYDDTEEWAVSVTTDNPSYDRPEVVTYDSFDSVPDDVSDYNIFISAV